MPSRAFISLGSNSPNATEMLCLARNSLQKLGKLSALSPIYLTEPQGYPDQPWFHNQIIGLTPHQIIEAGEFMRKLLEIETSLGRIRTKNRFGPRCIDLDLLLFDDQLSADPHCTLPHPRMTQRAFVLIPLADIAPDIIIYGHTPAYWLSLLSWRKEGCKIFQPYNKENSKCGNL